MKKCIDFFTKCWQKNKQSPKLNTNFRNKTKEQIEQSEIDAFIDLEMYNMPVSFIEKYGIENVLNKLKQQYYWTINNKIENPDLYIPLNAWHDRFTGS